MKRSGKFLFSLLVAAAVAVAGLWIITMVRAPEPTPLPADTPGMYRHDPLPGLPYDHKPGAVGVIAGVTAHINSRGLRGREIDLDKPEGVIRIAALGDSVVFGQGVPDDSTLPALLERTLNQSGTNNKFEVLNAGVRGYNTSHYLAFLENRILPLDPDLVVLVITEINDPESEPFRAGSEKLDRWKKAWWMKLPFAKTLMAGAYSDEIRRLFEAHVREIYGTESKDWKRFTSDLQSIRDVLAEKDIPMVAVTFPLLADVNPFKEERKRLRDELSEQGIRWIDPAPLFAKHPAGDLVVSESDFHPNEKALSLTAELAAKEVLEILGGKEN